MTVRVQPDGYILEIGRDGSDRPIASMACREQKEAEALAESICANMRKAYWWHVMPVIFGEQYAADARVTVERTTVDALNSMAVALGIGNWTHVRELERAVRILAASKIELPADAIIRAAMLTPGNDAPSDLAAPADSPEQNGSQPEPMIKIDFETGQRKSTPLEGPETGVCLNCGARMGAPHMCTDGESFHRVAWCGECGAFHAQGTPDDGGGWSVATPTGRPSSPAPCFVCEAPGDGDPMCAPCLETLRGDAGAT